MKTPLYLSIAAGIVASTLSLASARADVPPPDGYVETCTLEVQQTPGRDCLVCGNGMVAAPNPCSGYSLTGYGKCCQSYGASVWTEVWCRDCAGTAGAPGNGGAGGASTGAAAGQGNAAGTGAGNVPVSGCEPNEAAVGYPGCAVMTNDRTRALGSLLLAVVVAWALRRRTARH